MIVSTVLKCYGASPFGRSLNSFYRTRSVSLPRFASLRSLRSACDIHLSCSEWHFIRCTTATLTRRNFSRPVSWVNHEWTCEHIYRQSDGSVHTLPKIWLPTVRYSTLLPWNFISNYEVRGDGIWRAGGRLRVGSATEKKFCCAKSALFHLVKHCHRHRGGGA